MLQTIRDRASGWFAYLIVGFIIIPFALWGLNEYFGGGAQLVAAEVNGVEIPVRAYQDEYRDQRQRLQAMFGGRVPPELLNEQVMRENAIQTLVRKELLQQLASKEGYRASPAAVLDAIRDIGAFQREGHFDVARYTQVLESQRLTKAGFEANIAQGLVLDQFQNGIRDSAFVPAASVEDYLRLRDQTRELSYLIVPAERYAATAQVDDAMVEQYFREHTAAFQTPERVRLAYVELSERALVAQITVDEDEVRRYFDDHADRYATPEERRVSIILARVGHDAGAADERAARERIEALATRIQAGEDFAVVAREGSDDELSRTNGGDIGFIARGDMDPALDAVVFTLPVGTASVPLRTAQGFQLAQVTEIKPAVGKPYDEVRAQVEAELRSQAAERRFLADSERLLTLSYENGDSLEPAAGAIGADIQTSGWVSRDRGEGIGQFSEVRRAAFSDEVLRERRNSDMLELPDGRLIVVRVDEVQPAAQRPLGEVQGEIREILKRQVMQTMARADGEKLLAAVDGGDRSLAQAGRELGLDVVRTGAVTRGAQEVPPAVLARVFNMAPPDADRQVRHAGLELPGAGYAVIALTAVHDAAADADVMRATARTLGRLHGALELDAYLRTLEAGAKIRIYRDNL
ncbi:MAG: SurA N-terminal domain-containing protein [Chromatiales bacterium]|nr:SurA N-terminal domain-containing protein [Chromatiales bacterium]